MAAQGRRKGREAHLLDSLMADEAPKKPTTPAPGSDEELAALQSKGLGGASAAGMGMPPSPSPQSQPPLAGMVQPMLDFFLNKYMMDINPQGLQRHPMFGQLQPPPGMPQLGNEGPMSLPPQTGMPLPR